MAQERLTTPERDLLKLIENRGNEGSLHAAAIKRRGLGLFSFGALMARFDFLKKRLKDFKKEGIQQLDIKVVNRVLSFFILFLAFYFVFNLSTSLIHLNKPLDLKLLKTKNGVEIKSSAAPSFLKAASYYLEKIRERDIFRMGAKKTTIEVPRGLTSRISEVTQNLRLVGISWSVDPDVMIEDIGNHITYFFKKGQLIKNEIKIEAILKDKVILSYRGEEIELK